MIYAIQALNKQLLKVSNSPIRLVESEEINQLLGELRHLCTQFFQASVIEGREHASVINNHEHASVIDSHEHASVIEGRERVNLLRHDIRAILSRIEVHMPEMGSMIVPNGIMYYTDLTPRSCKTIDRITDAVLNAMGFESPNSSNSSCDYTRGLVSFYYGMDTDILPPFWIAQFGDKYNITLFSLLRLESDLQLEGYDPLTMLDKVGIATTIVKPNQFSHTNIHPGAIAYELSEEQLHIYNRARRAFGYLEDIQNPGFRIKALLEANPDPYHHFSEIVQLIRQYKHKEVAMYLKYGFNVNAHDENGWTLLMHAMHCLTKFKQSAMVRTLVRYGAHVPIITDLFRAIEVRNYPLLDTLATTLVAANVDINVALTLSLKMEKPDLECIRILMSNQCNPHVPDADGLTAIQYARQNDECLALLLDIPRVYRQTDEDGLCQICCTNNASIIYCPCGHLCICNECSLVEDGKYRRKCITCNLRVIETIDLDA